MTALLDFDYGQESTGELTAIERVLPCSHRGKTVSKLFVVEPLGLALSEKQIPQIVETIRSVENSKKLWRPSRCV